MPAFVVVSATHACIHHSDLYVAIILYQAGNRLPNTVERSDSNLA